MRRSWFTWLSLVGCAALVAAAVATAGLGGTPEGRGPDRPLPAPSSSAAPVTSALLRRVDLRETDLPSGFRLVGTRHRVDPASEDAVRLCGTALAPGSPSPAVRASTFVGDGSGRVRTVVAAYAAGRVEAVLTRLRSVSSSCARPVRPGRQEQPATLALRVLTGQAPDRFRHEVAVLRRGDVVAVVAVDAAPDRFGDGPRAGLGLPLDRSLARRLVAALP